MYHITTYLRVSNGVWLKSGICDLPFALRVSELWVSVRGQVIKCRMTNQVLFFIPPVVSNSRPQYKIIYCNYKIPILALQISYDENQNGFTTDGECTVYK